ncbi:ankyrin repeat protein [Aulographum hederae CBS 113979]|uniref:Ankyrin repeat protein n=1 Tax=Aulographum hederae CBS 113979 TaxID=1176131 RepID=A0A6G1GUN1_9PEZI|nr:ankyrin repeat protein [Aulographum hederae CBS 113979]
MSSNPTIAILLNLVPDNPSLVLAHISSHPDLASRQDTHGYSLLHAASSYGQLDLLRALVNDHKVDVNIVDEDGETPLYVAETVEVARCLVEELGADAGHVNEEGKTALERMVEDDENPEVQEYLKGITAEKGKGKVSSEIHSAEEVHPPPPLPPNVQINVGTMSEAEEGEAPDPEFRRKIEELAAREDFQTEEGQRELRNLVTEAVGGLKVDNSDGRKSSRRRVE